jgi:hypothetical protein
MRKPLLLLPILLAACATGGMPGITAQKCEAAGAERFVGQAGTSESGAAIMQATRSAVLRWAPPGTMLTMDYREDRVTVHLGADGKVTEIKCG